VKFVQNDDDPFFTFIDATPDQEADPQMQGVIAYAFFPGTEPRQVVLFSIFSQQNNRISVLGHELGHLLI